MEKIVVSCLESRIDENQSVYSRFLLGPFLSGHAVTVATALRRALLSEVKNIAITALHIQGVTHEFSTLIGIRESVLELSLNFQQIILSTQTKSRSVQIGYLHVQGPAIVHANDLKLPDGIECVNPRQYIATLSTEGLLVVKFLIGEKKSFLKSNTSTLNNTKIKEAKVYSAHLSKCLLTHAEYDPPRLFRLLRNQSLPNGAIVRETIEDESTFQLANSNFRVLSKAEQEGEHAKVRGARVTEGAKTNFLPEPGSDTPPRELRASQQSTLFDKGKLLPPSVGNRNVSPAPSAEVDSQIEPKLSLKEQNLFEPTSTKVEFLTGSVRNEATPPAGPVDQKAGSKQTHKGSLPRSESARSEPSVGAVGQQGLEPKLEQLLTLASATQKQGGGNRNSISVTSSSNSSVPRVTHLTDSILDQSANHISDEFNSEVCLRTIIPLDPIFTPVYQVNFGIERDDLSNQIRERVIMEVWTNGSIHPRQAINEAALSTMSIFSKLRKTFQLDSHSLALSANSTAPLATFGRGSRLHKTKSMAKGGVVNDDASESVEPLAALLSLALRSRAKEARSPLALRSRAPVTRDRFSPVAKLELRGEPPSGVKSSPNSNLRSRFAKVSQARLPEQSSGYPRRGFTEGGKRRVNVRNFALAKPIAGTQELSRSESVRLEPPKGVQRVLTELDLTNSARQKLNSFSSLGFVRSRHPVSLFLQNFGRSHIQGQTFLLEQSFGLKARFFKGQTRAPRTFAEHAKISLEYSSETELPSVTVGTKFRNTFKKTFLPSFKLVRGPFGSNRNNVAARSKSISSSLTQPNLKQNQAGLTKASLLFKLRFCLAGTPFDPSWGGSRCSDTQSKDRAVNQVSIGLGRLLLVLSKSEQKGEHGSRLESSKTFALAKAMKGGALLSFVFAPRRGAEEKGARSSCTQNLRFCERLAKLNNKVSTSPKEVSTFRLSKNHSSGRLSRVTSWSNLNFRLLSKAEHAKGSEAKVTARIAEQSETRQFAYSVSLSKQRKPKPILFLIKYRTFSFTRNALRIFRSNQKDSLFLLPLAKQLIRVKMARVFTSCLPLISKRLEPSLPFSFTGTQAFTTVDGSNQLDVKQVLLSVAALRSRARSYLGVESNSFGSETLAERGAPLFGTRNSVSSLPQNQEVRDLSRSESSRTSSSAMLGRRLSKKVPKSILSKQPEKSGRRRPVGGAEGGLEVRANFRLLVLSKAEQEAEHAKVTQKRIASLIAQHAITPFDRNVVPAISRSVAFASRKSGTPFRLPPEGGFRARSSSSRSNLKKQFGFFQFACNGFRPGHQRGVVQDSMSKGLADSHSATFPTGLKERWMAQIGSTWPHRGVERFGVCVNRTKSLANPSRPGPVRALSLRSLTLLRSKSEPSESVSEAKRNRTVSYDFTAFPLGCFANFREAKVQLPERSSGYTWFCYAEPRRGFRVAKRYCFAMPLIMTKAPPLCLSSGFVNLLSSLGPTGLCTRNVVPASKSSARPFQLVPQPGTEFRLPTEGGNRLSILYSSNLDKMSFLSSDLANLSLSLKTYTFLKKKGKNNIASLLEYSPSTLFSLLNGDEKMFHEIERCILFLGLPFKERS